MLYGIMNSKSDAMVFYGAFKTPLSMDAASIALQTEEGAPLLFNTFDQLCMFMDVVNFVGAICPDGFKKATMPIVGMADPNLN